MLLHFLPHISITLVSTQVRVTYEVWVSDIFHEAMQARLDACGCHSGRGGDRVARQAGQHRTEQRHSGLGARARHAAQQGQAQRRQRLLRGCQVPDHAAGKAQPGRQASQLRLAWHDLGAHTHVFGEDDMKCNLVYLAWSNEEVTSAALMLATDVLGGVGSTPYSGNIRGYRIYVKILALP